MTDDELTTKNKTEECRKISFDKTNGRLLEIQKRKRS